MDEPPLKQRTTKLNVAAMASLKHKLGHAQRAKQRAKREAERIREHAKRASNALTQSRLFRKLVDWTFRVCDSKRTNHITSDQLYSGLLLVHLNLARFCGSAACMPPSRKTVHDLFEASDVDESGGIDREEFNIIVNVTCAQIFSRVLINYATLILVIPFFAQIIVDRWGIANGTYLEKICEQFIGTLLFVCLIPVLWKIVDSGARQEAGRQAKIQRSNKSSLHSNPLTLATERPTDFSETKSEQNVTSHTKHD